MYGVTASRIANVLEQESNYHYERGSHFRDNLTEVADALLNALAGFAGLSYQDRVIIEYMQKSREEFQYLVANAYYKFTHSAPYEVHYMSRDQVISETVFAEFR